MDPKKDIVSSSINSPNYTRLVAAVKTAGLVGTLQGEWPFRVDSRKWRFRKSARRNCGSFAQARSQAKVHLSIDLARLGWELYFRLHRCGYQKGWGKGCFENRTRLLFELRHERKTEYCSNGQLWKYSQHYYLWREPEQRSLLQFCSKVELPAHKVGMKVRFENTFDFRLAFLSAIGVGLNFS